MIFLEKQGRFGNFLFQYFVAKFIQESNGQKIIVFSKNENVYEFNSKKNIDKIIENYFSLPKFSKFLNFFKKNIFEVNETNYKKLTNEDFKRKNFYIKGFFQDIDFIVSNKNLLLSILNKKKILPKSDFEKSDITIHIRHLHYENGNIDNHPDYQIQPDLNFYKKIIEKKQPKKIKIISSSNNNQTFLNLKNLYGDKVYFEGKDDISDFFNIVNSKNIVLSVSTFSLWASLFSEAEEIFVPNIGILKKILNKKQSSILSRFKYID